MSTALTFYFKEIFENKEQFLEYLKDFEIANVDEIENKIFGEYLFKILYRKYHNSNIQYDTIGDFKYALANILEDEFDKYKKQLDFIQKLHQLTAEEVLQVSTALANSANNPNTKPTDPLKPFDYVGSQVYSIASNGKLAGYVQALRAMPNKMIGEILTACSGLFKTIIPDEIFIVKGGKIQ